MALNNNVTLIGRLTKDLELKKTTQGLSVVTFTLAVDKFKDGADFISCQAWRQSAEYLSQYAGKGYMIALNGKIATRSYDNQQGQKVYVTEVVADSVKILSSPNKEQQATQQPSQYDSMDDLNSYQGIEINSDDLPF